MATTSPYGIERRHTPDRREGHSHLRHTRALSTIDWIAMTLLIVGGINWGLVGLFSFDLVATLFGAMSPVSRIIYVLVGLSAFLYYFYRHKIGKPI
jgi:uncharacterized membrane protein YuzA (DUF378 family)